jgi:hypothetical protein
VELDRSRARTDGRKLKMWLTRGEYPAPVRGIRREWQRTQDYAALCSLICAARGLYLHRYRALDTTLERFHEIDDVSASRPLRLFGDDRVSLQLLPYELLERRAVVILELLGIKGPGLLFDELHRKIGHVLLQSCRGHLVAVFRQIAQRVGMATVDSIVVLKGKSLQSWTKAKRCSRRAIFSSGMAPTIRGVYAAPSRASSPPSWSTRSRFEYCRMPAVPAHGLACVC